jgi:hypothetical protein
MFKIFFIILINSILYIISQNNNYNNNINNNINRTYNDIINKETQINFSYLEEKFINNIKEFLNYIKTEEKEYYNKNIEKFNEIYNNLELISNTNNFTKKNEFFENIILNFNDKDKIYIEKFLNKNNQIFLNELNLNYNNNIDYWKKNEDEENININYDFTYNNGRYIRYSKIYLITDMIFKSFYVITLIFLGFIGIFIKNNSKKILKKIKNKFKKYRNLNIIELPNINTTLETTDESLKEFKLDNQKEKDVIIK